MPLACNPATPTHADAMHRLALPLACLCLLAATESHAHGGGLNADGCHTNRKTGDYHCHRSPASGAPRRNLAPSYRRSAPLNLSPRDDTRPGGAFRNCDAARAAGTAPVHRGEPGYGPHLDRDNDGIGCEPYRGR